MKNLMSEYLGWERKFLFRIEWRHLQQSDTRRTIKHRHMRLFILMNFCTRLAKKAILLRCTKGTLLLWLNIDS